MSSIKFVGFFVIAMTLMVVCHAQLTFTPAWGKRSGGFNMPQQPSQFNNVPAEACKTPVETLMLIYRLIQTEAQKLIDCSEQQK